MRTSSQNNARCHQLLMFVGTALLLVAAIPGFASDTTWFAFSDSKTELIGFKDETGKVRIEPKFMGFTQAQRFQHIMAVMEQQGDDFIGYYLTKKGKRVGLGNLYVDQDNSVDCESEQAIRFRDAGTERVGFYAGDGNVLIPAIYSDALPFRNGIALVIKDAVRTCHDGSLYSTQNRCEHWGWTQGITNLINKRNEVLIENLQLDAFVDWHSMKVSDRPLSEPNWLSLSGRDGKYYNFLDIQREFKAWLMNDFLLELNSAQLEKFTFEEVTYWTQAGKWISEARQKYLSRNQKLMLSELQRIAREPESYFISTGGLNPFIYSDKKYLPYFDNCGNAKEWQYPLMSVVINRSQGGEEYQNHFDFLRTVKGYRLVSLGIK